MPLQLLRQTSRKSTERFVGDEMTGADSVYYTRDELRGPDHRPVILTLNERLNSIEKGIVGSFAMSVFLTFALHCRLFNVDIVI
jgi:hypothetical protein